MISPYRTNNGYRFRIEVRETETGWERRYLWDEPSPQNRPLIGEWERIDDAPDVTGWTTQGA